MAHNKKASQLGSFLLVHKKSEPMANDILV